MPDALKRFLECLNEGDCDEILDYLDGNEDAIAEMVQILQHLFV